MKKRMLKIVATMLSLVLVFSCVSTGAVALNKDGITVDELKGYVAVDVMVNNSQSAAVVALEKQEDSTISFAVTTNGTDYTFIDLLQFWDKNHDVLEVAGYTVMNDDFVFLLRSYLVEEIWSDEDNDYYYNYEIAATTIVSTKDGVNLTSKSKDFDNWSKADGYDSDLYVYFGLFDVVGDKLVYANTAYTDLSGSEEFYARDVYFFTSDLENWGYSESHKEIKLDRNENYYCTAYQNANGVLIEEKWRLPAEDKYERTLILDKVKCNSKEIFNLSDEQGTPSVLPMYGTLKNVPDTVFRFESILSEAYYQGKDDGSMRIVKVDLNTEKQEVLWENDSDFRWFLVNLENTVYFLEYDENDYAKIYRFDEDMKLEDTGLGKVKVNYAKGLQNKAFIFSESGIYVFDEEGYKKYETSNIIEDTTYSVAFILNEDLFVLNTPEKGVAKVFTASEKAPKIGDIDGDGRIISSDALFVLQYTTGLKELTDEQKAVANVDNNSEINSADALAILQYATGLITSFK
ncbi:MAG: dockerin type I repeat-containing protein [Clostridia bacterium]|nr:dockerin type I repeat-containing protein [Clostridia bacterium]